MTDGTEAATPVEYTGRVPETLEEANALYQRYIDGEISLPDHMVAACLEVQARHINPIPKQLRDCRFVKVYPKEKRPIGEHWQDNNYDYGDLDLLDHIRTGGNYGVMPFGGVCIIDADNLTSFASAGILEKLEKTFTVMSGREDGGRHFYVYCPDALNEKIGLYDPATGSEAGDLRGSGHKNQVVGPGSLHPSGKRYTVIDPGAPLMEMKWSELKSLLAPLMKGKKNPSPKAPQPSRNVARGSDDEILSRCLKTSKGKFKALFEGDISGYSSPSEADLALCTILAMHTRDAGQIDRLFRQSGLNREKWDREDYSGRTIAKALSGVNPSNRRICLTNRPLQDITTDALCAIQEANEPPRLFIRGGEMVFPDRDEKGIPFIRALTEHGLKGELARASGWYRLKKGKDGWEETTAIPTLETARDILSRPTLEWGLYPLASLTQTPVIDLETGKFRDTEGYDLRTWTYYLPSTGFALSEIPEKPTDGDISRGKEIIEDIFHDFPFVDDQSRHNAYGGLVTAVLRPVIPGPVPLFLVDKPQAGSGASLMQKCIYTIATGEAPEEGGAPERDEEWEKVILSILAKGRQIYTFDNIDRKLSSETLSRLLTSINYTERVLGTNRNVTYPNRVFWQANGNNVEIGGDIARRMWVSKIDPQMALPWQRTDFKHPDILSWSRDHRGEIVGAVFILTRGWIQAGAPSPTKIPVLGGYEGWHEIIGGIMEFTGYTEFLQNVNKIAIEGDIELKQDEEFLTALLDTFESTSWQVRDIELAMENEKDRHEAGKVLLSNSLPDRLADAWKDPSQDFKKRCGRYLRAKKEKRYPNGLMVTNRIQDLHDKVQRWCVLKWKEIPQTPQTAQAQLSTSGVCGDCGVSHGQYVREKKEEGNVHAYYNRHGNSPQTPQTPHSFIPVHVLMDLDPFVGIDGRTYSLNRGDIASLPEPNARALIDRHAAVEVQTSTPAISIPTERAIHISDEDGDE
ncbi:MAG: bifunctional DNA primase/polymerase [Methanolinea sp.]